MVKYIINKSDNKLFKNIKLYEIEFSDLFHITSLSEDCFGVIKEFCGTSYCGNLSNDDVNKKFWFACEYGLFDIIGKIFERHDKEIIFKSGWPYRYYGFHKASRNGHLKVLVWMKTEFPDLINNAFKSSDYYGFRYASQNGHLKVLVWMKTVFPDLINDAFTSVHYDGFCRASFYGHLEVLVWMKTEFPDLINDAFKSGDYDGFCLASENGHLKVLVWMKTEFPDLMKKINIK